MILETIVKKKEAEVAELKQRGIHLPRGYIDTSIDSPRGFRRALVEHKGVAVIAEAKKASPSKGVISADFDVCKIVRHYENHGAQAVSVLTDTDFFQGSLEYLLMARETISLPVLRKDFIIDAIQIEESARYGADAILLIAAILDRYQIGDYLACARELQMDILVEVHNEEEVDKAMESECDLIGINNRNLNDFSVDIETTFRLKKLIPESVPVVSESGLKTGDDMRKLAENGITAALIGETLMRAGTDGNGLEVLRQGL